jgi:DDE family transposase
MTECKTEQYKFHALGSREVVGHFDGGDITSDAGGLLLREVEKRTGIIRRFAACFQDRRDPRFTEFTVEELAGQRIYGLALGYEDLNDHDQLRWDPALAVMVGKEDVKGEKRRVAKDRGQGVGWKEHTEPAGAHARRCLQHRPVQEDWPG